MKKPAENKDDAVSPQAQKTPKRTSRRKGNGRGRTITTKGKKQ
jgi:hypothetical protein